MSRAVIQIEPDGKTCRHCGAQATAKVTATANGKTFTYYTCDEHKPEPVQ